MSGIRAWWRALTLREKRLVAVMMVLVAVVFLWLGIIRPVQDGLARANADHLIAVDRAARIAAAVDALKASPARVTPKLDAALDQVVSQSATEGGFTIESSNLVGPDRVTIAIASARASALFGWLAGLEARGVVVETITIQPGANNTVSVRALLKVAQ